MVQVELVEPPLGATPGDRVEAAGFSSDPVAVLQKDAFGPIATSLATNDKLIACYNGVALQTDKGSCRVKSISNGAIR